MSDVGQKRNRNEDSYLMNEGLQLYIVADGMGGHVGGDLASRLAVETIEETIKKLTAKPNVASQSSEEVKPGEFKTHLAYAIKMASRKIFEKALQDSKLQGMGTTTVVLLLRKNKAFLANVGDSRGYRIRGEKIEQLTTDHSLVEEQVRAGVLLPEEAKQHRYKNVITRSVGFQDEVDVDTQAKVIKANDIFVLCSDGLYNQLEAEEMLDVISHHDLQESCQHLVDIANSRGGDDNITVILVKVLSIKGEEEEETAALQS